MTSSVAAYIEQQINRIDQEISYLARKSSEACREIDKHCSYEDDTTAIRSLHIIMDMASLRIKKEVLETILRGGVFFI